MPLFHAAREAWSTRASLEHGRGWTLVVFRLVGNARFERAAYGSGGHRSIQLS